MAPRLWKLEKALDASIAEGVLDENAIGDYLKENSNVDLGQSARLHELLFKYVPVKEDPPSVLLEAVVQLVSCLINQENLVQWFDRLAPIAFDSGGHSNTVVRLCREFLNAVISAAGTDESISVYEQNAAMFVQLLADAYANIDTFLNLEAVGPSERDERWRFARYNCRNILTSNAAKNPLNLMEALNKWLVLPNYRLDFLQVVSEFISGHQQGKLFQIWQSPLFESLVRILEYDKDPFALEIASTSLAMVLPHICDKLGPILPRLFAAYGRLCCWKDGSLPHDPTPTDWKTLYPAEMSEKGMNVAFNDAEIATCQHPPNVVPLFTFLYGLFPNNTLVFCQDADGYLNRYKYRRPFSDMWSSSQILEHTKAHCTEFVLHPSLLCETPEGELENSAFRWHEFTSRQAIILSCTDLHIDLSSTTVSGDSQDEEDSTLARLHQLMADHQNLFQAMISQAEPGSLLISPESQQVQSDTELTPVTSRDFSSLSVLNTARAALESTSGSLKSPMSLRETAQANTTGSRSTPTLKADSDPYTDRAQVDSSSISASKDTDVQNYTQDQKSFFYYRELLLCKNELDFANFARYLVKRKVIALQKRLSALTMSDVQCQELERLNKRLSARLEASEKGYLETQRKIQQNLDAKNEHISAMNLEISSLCSRMSDSEATITKLTAENEKLLKEKAEMELRLNEHELAVSKLEDALSFQDQQKNRKPEDEAKAVLQQIATDGDGELQTQQRIARDYEKRWLETKEQLQAAQVDRAQRETRLENQVAMLQAKLNEAERRAASKSEDTANRLRNLVADFNSKTDERYLKLELAHKELIARCGQLERELQARQIHEEERISGLRSALMSAAPFSLPENEERVNRVRGRGGAQGMGRW